MRLTEYNILLDDEQKPYLVKERAFNYTSDLFVNSPRAVYDLMETAYGLTHKAAEYTYLLSLNSAGKVLGIFQCSKGGISESSFPIREMVQFTLLNGGRNLIIVHNHPTGNSTPSKEDKESTERLKKATNIVGLALLDHIIIGTDYFSFHENNLV